MKRHLISLAVTAAVALAPFAAMAADSTPTSAPQQNTDLTPGPAAGVQKAQMFAGDTATYAVIAVVAIGIIAAAASGGGGGNSANSTTGTLP